MIFTCLVILGLFLLFPRVVVGALCITAIGSAVLFLLGVVVFIGALIYGIAGG